ncbi:hypothetical protein [Streptomyces dubilierae]|uniref:Uncharacterized protein n=1 Tax=Streptomyces dubilierae TaxID=3075533 RepID=A0ABU2P1J3_9ACTN|nr:hypothetical protein [Streptomyces sp. DSM 41921]MDT0385975.1 hypothetical protein [Streptomyces sp. DSM 41921]
MPENLLPAAFLDFQPRQVIATTNEFVVSGQSEAGAVRLYGSKDGISWYRAEPDEGIPAYVASYLDRVTLAGQVSNGGSLVPAVWRTKNARHWKQPEILPGGVASDEVLAVAHGPRGTILVAHDGGPFSNNTDDGTSAYRGESLRLWTAKGDGPFGQPREVPCPASPTRKPHVSIVADAAGFVVTAACTNRSQYTKRLVVTSHDGTHWAGGPDQFKQQTTETGTSGERGSILVTRTESSDASPGVFLSTLWSRTKGADDWKRGRPLDVGRVPDTGVAPRDQQSLNAVSAVPGGFIAAGRSMDLRHGPVGALWTSRDGRHWIKQSTKKNHFDQVFDLYGAAELHGRYILLGQGALRKPADTNAAARLWIGSNGTAPSLRQEDGPASFTGTWTWGQGSLAIDKAGHFTYRWRLFRDCDSHAAPCDTATVWGGKATGVLKPTEDGRSLRGRLNTTNLPHDPRYREGATMEVKRMPYSAVFVRVDGRDHGYFCDAGPSDSRCIAAHG